MEISIIQDFLLQQLKKACYAETLKRIISFSLRERLSVCWKRREKIRTCRLLLSKNFHSGTPSSDSLAL